MEIKISNDAHADLKAFRNWFESDEFGPGKKKMLNVILHAYSVDGKELVATVDWDERHFPVQSIEIGKGAQKSLATFLEHLNRFRESAGKKPVTPDQAVSCIVVHANTRLTDESFRKNIIDSLLGAQRNPELLLLIELPKRIYTEYEAEGNRSDKKRSAEKVISDVLESELRKLTEKEVAKLAAPDARDASAGVKTIKDTKFAAIKIDKAIKEKLSPLRPFAASVVRIIEKLSPERSIR